jgi:hypothetical protein
MVALSGAGNMALLKHYLWVATKRGSKSAECDLVKRAAAKVRGSSGPDLVDTVVDVHQVVGLNRHGSCANGDVEATGVVEYRQYRFAWKGIQSAGRNDHGRAGSDSARLSAVPGADLRRADQTNATKRHAQREKLT